MKPALTGPIDVDVMTSHGTATASVDMAQVSPAWFTYNLQGALYPVAFFNGESVYVAAADSLPGVSSRPAKPGDNILLYANGLGLTSLPYPVGQVLSQAYPVADLSRIKVFVGGVPAPVQFAGMAFAGVFQVNIQVPDGIGEGDLAVVLQVGGQSTQPNAVLTFGK